MEFDGAEITVGTPQTRTVLALLAWHANEVVTLGRMADELWGEAPPPSAKVQLQGVISRLRRLLGRDRIATTPTGYLFHATEKELDVELVQEDLRTARRLIADGEVAFGALKLREALGRWHGPDQLTELRVTVLEERIDADLRLGSTADLIGELTAVVAEHPLRERFRAQLMTALARRGRVAEALDVFLSYRRTMVDELGVEPSACLRELHSRILRGDHEPDFPVPGKAHRPRMLPPALPDFVGRDDLLTDVLPPLVVVTGAAGIGKTSFAVRLAHRVHFPDGQLFATLRDDTTAVLHQFLRALGVPADLVPSTEDQSSALLRDVLAGREVLMVLDNAVDASQVRPFVPAEPGSALLVTSRRSLTELEGARLVRLGLFDAHESAELLTRITGTPPGEALIERCGGLPLALRIAGALLLDRPHWTSTDLAARLADARTRLDWLHAGDLDVRASIAESYRRLPPCQQMLLRRLGKLPTPAVSSQLGPDHVLENLVSWHLVSAVGRGSAVRYGLHELVRSFALEQDEAARAVSAGLQRGDLVARVRPDVALLPWQHVAEEPVVVRAVVEAEPAAGAVPRALGRVVQPARAGRGTEVDVTVGEVADPAVAVEPGPDAHPVRRTGAPGRGGHVARLDEPRRGRGARRQ